MMKTRNKFEIFKMDRMKRQEKTHHYYECEWSWPSSCVFVNMILCVFDYETSFFVVVEKY